MSTSMDAKAQQYMYIVVAALLGGGIVYLAVRPNTPAEPAAFQGEFTSVGRPPDAAPPTVSTDAASMSDEVYTAVHDRVRAAIEETAAPNPEGAANATTEYAAFVADGDVDRILSLGLPVGAVPYGETVARFRTMLAGFPPRAQPSGWRTFNDIQVLRWGFASARMARWKSVALETIDARYFPAGPVSDELAQLWKMNPPPGYESSGDAMALFQIPDLNKRAQRGEVASLLVSFAVEIERGDRWLITVHLAEYEPGEWYPVAHRQDVAKSVDPFPAERAPRPR